MICKHRVRQSPSACSKRTRPSPKWESNLVAVTGCAAPPSAAEMESRSRLWVVNQFPTCLSTTIGRIASLAKPTPFTPL
ncbi:hypothetical protein BO82DRAFT_355682, partial [Aspergillus uvarum CBS 121591]